MMPFNFSRQPSKWAVISPPLPTPANRMSSPGQGGLQGGTDAINAVCTPLIGALQTGREDSVLSVLDLHKRQQKQQRQQQLAKENDLDLSRPLDEVSNTVLHYSAIYNFPRLAKALLIEHGASLDLRNISGHTALDIAIGPERHERHKLLQVFLTHRQAQIKLRDAMPQKAQETEKEKKRRLVERAEQAALVEKTFHCCRQQKGTEETRTTLSALTAAVTGWLLF